MKHILGFGFSLIFAASLQAQPDWEARLRDKDPAIRRHQALELGRKKLASAAPLLVEALRDPDVQVRDAAAMALYLVGSKSVPALVKSLTVGDKEIVGPVLDVIARLGPEAKEAIPVLIQTLRAKDLRHRILAAWALGFMAQDAKQALPDLFAMSGDTRNVGNEAPIGTPASAAHAAIGSALQIDPACRKELAKACLDSLIKALQSDDVGARRAAIEGLILLEGEARAALPALRKRLADPKEVLQPDLDFAIVHIDPKERFRRAADKDLPQTKRLSAVKDLSRRRPLTSEIVVLLIDLLRDRHAEIRAAAVLALENGGPSTRAAAPALAELLGDKDVQDISFKLRKEPFLVAQVMANLGKSAVPHVIKALREPKHGRASQYEGLMVLCDLAPVAGAAKDVVADFLDHDVVLIAILAGNAYVQMGGDFEKARPALEEGLRHKYPIAIHRSEQAVSRIGPRAAPLAPRIMELLDHPNRDVRLQAVHSLFKIGKADQSAISKILKLLATEKGEGRMYMLNAIGWFGTPKEALPELIRELDQLPQGTWYPALEQLAKMGPGAKLAVPKLITLLDNGKAPHANILETLGRIGEPMSVSAIAAQLKKPTREGSRAAAARALGIMGPIAKEAIPELEDAWKSPDPEVKIWAAFGLARVTGQVEKYAQLILKIKTEKPDGRDPLGPFGRAISADEAPQALAELGKDAGPYLVMLAHTLIDSATKPRTRESIIETLPLFPERRNEILAILLACLKEKADPSFDEHAARWRTRAVIDAISGYGPSAGDALPVLHSLLEDADRDMIGTITRAISSIEGKTKKGE